MTDGAAPEFSYIVQLSDIGAEEKGAAYEAAADGSQRAALAERFGCQEIQRLVVTATIKPLREKNYFRLSGSISARVVQTCVVSLEPVMSDIECEFSLILYPESETNIPDMELEDEDFEAYVDNAVDIGEICAVEMALALDPYPRAPGVSAEDIGPGGKNVGYSVNEEEKAGRYKPFEALAGLKRKS